MDRQQFAAVAASEDKVDERNKEIAASSKDAGRAILEGAHVHAEICDQFPNVEAHRRTSFAISTRDCRKRVRMGHL